MVKVEHWNFTGFAKLLKGYIYNMGTHMLDLVGIKISHRAQGYSFPGRHSLFLKKSEIKASFSQPVAPQPQASPEGACPFSLHKTRSL